MAALRGTETWKHLAVGGAVLGASVLGLLGVVGKPKLEEKFDAKQIVVVPDGVDGLRITEHVDQDFGSEKRHGYQRIIPVDFGVPTDIQASSPDAPDSVSSYRQSYDLVIRIGDPNKTITGQHRYDLSYTLPEARLSTNHLGLDIIGTNETLQTDKMEVIVAGLDLSDTICSVGRTGTSGGCELVEDTIGGSKVYRVTFEPLKAGEGVTIGASIKGRIAVPDIPVPPIAKRRSSSNLAVGLMMLPIGAVVAGGVFLWARRRGRNEVAGGGAADVAYADARPRPSTPVPPPPPSANMPLPAPSAMPPQTMAAGVGGRLGSMSTRKVTDAELARMATIEFVPPKGLQPWEGQALLSEQVDNSTVSAWFSGLAAHDVVTFAKEGRDTVVSPGPKYEQATAVDREVLDWMFGGRGSVTLGKYDSRFASAWTQARSLVSRSLVQSQFWSSGLRGGGFSASNVGKLMPILFVVMWMMVAGFGSAALSALSFLRGRGGAILFAVVVAAAAAFALYRSLLPARTAHGSALALRTESFRRFLAASEAKHVDWAWKHGLLREYSAWAVALGEADAWRHAMDASGVPRAELDNGPMLVYYATPSFGRTYTQPAPSGGGGGGWGGGGFGGGSVGGGGGGGSSGSW